MHWSYVFLTLTHWNVFPYSLLAAFSPSDDNVVPHLCVLLPKPHAVPISFTGQGMVPFSHLTVPAHTYLPRKKTPSQFTHVVAIWLQWKFLSSTSLSGSVLQLLMAWCHEWHQAISSHSADWYMWWTCCSLSWHLVGVSVGVSWADFLGTPLNPTTPLLQTIRPRAINNLIGVAEKLG